jgi:4-hydroxythreonine-4-phosphate dehydrogenase
MSPHASRREAPIAITMGDPCGIGPEIVAKLLADQSSAGCFVVGDAEVMRRAAACAGVLASVVVIATPEAAWSAPPGCIPVLQVEGLPEGLSALPWGRVDARAGAAAARCIELAAGLALDGEVRAVVTAPIHKAAFAAAGVHFPGHTEMLQALATQPGQPLLPVRMMLANDELRVVLVTIHQSLRSALDAVTFEAVLETVRIAQAAALGWGLTCPRIAVAGLNPHAGEGGLFGDEELRIIGPAVDAARAEGMNVSGPHAPDTVFMRARHAANHPGEFDIVVAMTHDQGLIPVKYLGVERGVNVTLGLPFVRTSPDHGTAFDKAGTGLADPQSIAAALNMARNLSGILRD